MKVCQNKKGVALREVFKLFDIYINGKICHKSASIHKLRQRYQYIDPKLFYVQGTNIFKRAVLSYRVV